MSLAPLLQVSGLKAYYQMRFFGVTREVRAVDDISFTIRRNEIYGLAGESSSGKTTLIKTIARAIRPPLNVVGGSVTFDFKDGRRDVYAMSPAELDAIRWSRLSYVSQGSMNVLNPVRRIRHSFVDFAARHLGGTRQAFFAAVSAHLRRLSLDPKVLDAYPHEMSGGMRQRLTIALATICRPEFIIADEPTTALDVIVQKGVLAMLREVQQEMGSSILFVTHDMAVHANLTDRLGIMYAGRLVEEGPTARGLPAPVPSLYGASHLQPAPDRGRGQEGRPAGVAAEPRRPAGGLPLPSPLPAGGGALPRGGAAAGGARAGASRRLPCRQGQGQRGGPGMTTLLEIRQVSKTFRSGGLFGRHVVQAVDSVDFALASERPEIFTIIGESGSRQVDAGADDPEQRARRAQGRSCFAAATSRPSAAAATGWPSWPRSSRCSRIPSRRSTR